MLRQMLILVNQSGDNVIVHIIEQLLQGFHERVAESRFPAKISEILLGVPTQTATSGILDDHNYNVMPNGAHAGGNANHNENDDDARLRSVIAQTNARIMGYRRPVASLEEHASI